MVAKRMKVCIVGHSSKTLDIGESKACFEIARRLRRECQIITMRPDEILSPVTLSKLRNFRPDIVHYMLGPRLKSLLALRLFSLVGKGCYSVVSAPRPAMSLLGLILAKAIKPHLILAQSRRDLKNFRRFGFNAKFLGNGVDVDRFAPVSSVGKESLRKKYDIPLNKFVIIHVGHITPWRGLEIFRELAREPRYHVLIVASISWMTPYPSLMETLQGAGCYVITDFVESIEEIYQLADCYLFPGRESGETKLPLIFPRKRHVPSIEIPLSVLEAMACNLPTITSRFGGLPDLFQEENGYYFINRDAEASERLREIVETMDEVKTRQMVSNYSWNHISHQIMEIYTDLLASRGQSYASN